MTLVVGTKRRIGIDSKHAAEIAGLAAIGAEGCRVAFESDGSSDGGAAPYVFTDRFDSIGFTSYFGRIVIIPLELAAKRVKNASRAGWQTGGMADSG